MTPEQQKYKPYYKLLAAIINSAVKDFNTGKLPQRKAAAAFFRDECNDWMYEAVNATVHVVISRRLNGNPFDLKNISERKQ